MKENIRMVKNKAMENFFGLIIQFMRDNFLIIISKVLAVIIGQMAEST